MFNKRITIQTGLIMAAGIVFERGSINIVMPFLVIAIDCSTLRRNKEDTSYNLK